MKRTLLLLSIVAISVSATAQTQVKRYQPGVTTEGVTYYLPATALKITVVEHRVTKIPGDFKDYAQRYLRLADVPQQKETTWTIDKIILTPYGVPDTSKVYSIPLKKRTIAPLVGLTKDGIITSINTEESDEAPATVADVNKIEKPTLNPRDYMTEEILYAGSKSKMAELTAAEIYDIRDSRSQLSKGEADNMPKDGQQLKLMLSQLDTQETALLQLFKGTEERETRTVHFICTPNAETQRDIVFRFSDQLGVVDQDNLAGEPVYISIKDLKTVPAEETSTKNKKEDENAVRYNVPSDVKVTVFDRTRTYATLTTPMGQFGRVETLSTVLFDKNATTKVTFYSTTGGIRKLSDQGAVR
jgi:hypothetical protein